VKNGEISGLPEDATIRELALETILDGGDELSEIKRLAIHGHTTDAREFEEAVNQDAETLGGGGNFIEILNLRFFKPRGRGVTNKLRETLHVADGGTKIVGSGVSEVLHFAISGIEFSNLDLEVAIECANFGFDFLFLGAIADGA
jgi:hypothetical protein